MNGADNEEGIRSVGEQSSAEGTLTVIRMYQRTAYT